MYALVQRLNKSELFLAQLPSAAAALIIAELFYKFGSFTLECLGFLATWWLIDAAQHHIRRAVAGARKDQSDVAR